MKTTKRLSLAVLVCVCLAGFASPALALFGNKFEQELEKEREAVNLLRQAETGDYRLIATEELQQVLEDGKDVLLVDTMPYEESYKKAHIPKAVNFLFPIAEMTEWQAGETGNRSVDDFKELLGPDKDRRIVVYCGFVKCTRSHNGALWARRLGYTNVYRHPGGIYAWKGANYPVEKDQ